MAFNVNVRQDLDLFIYLIIYMNSVKFLLLFRYERYTPNIAGQAIGIPLTEKLMPQVRCVCVLYDSL